MINQETHRIVEGSIVVLDGGTKAMRVADVMEDLGIALINTDDAFGLHVVGLDRLSIARPRPHLTPQQRDEITAARAVLRAATERYEAATAPLTAWVTDQNVSADERMARCCSFFDLPTEDLLSAEQQCDDLARRNRALPLTTNRRLAG